MAQQQDDDIHRDLQLFLSGDFTPALARVEDWCRSASGKWGLSFDKDLPDEERTISPSDFGFHNAVKRHDGAIVFLDFEYFGWDAPAKLISDFLLHPGMDLSAGLKSQFTRAMLERLNGFSNLPQRVAALYPLFGLKWCLILLNEFVPADLQRRQSSGGGALDVAAVQGEQLTKSRNLLKQILNEYEHFPYHD